MQKSNLMPNDLNDPTHGCTGLLAYLLFPGWIIVIILSAIWSGFQDLATRVVSLARANQSRPLVLLLSILAYVLFMVWQLLRILNNQLAWTDIWTIQLFIVGIGTPLAVLWQYWFENPNQNNPAP